MSILIKEMEMPENCYDCLFCRYYDEPNQGLFCIPLCADLHRTDYIEKRLDACPLVHVPNNRGRWLPFEEEKDEDMIGPLDDFIKKFPHWQCSICGYKYISMDEKGPPHKYCPNCGAVMETKINEQSNA